MSNAAAIKKQIEFYFSDSNFRKDLFLRTAAEKDADGFVPISILLTFNRLKALSTDPAVIASALEGSETVVVSECKTKLRRANPLPEDDDSKARTLYAKGFPLGDAITIESIQELFSQFGNVLMVRLRRDVDKKFKGSVLVEFKTPDEMKKAVEESNKDGKVVLKYNDNELVNVCSYEDWIASKKSQGKKSTESAEKKPNQVEEKKEDNYTKNVILAISNVPAGCTVMQLKDALKAVATVRYVEYNDGDEKAFARAADETDAKTMLDAIAEKKIVVDGKPAELEASLLQGEEEKEYWSKIIEASGKGGKKRSGGRGGGRGGRGNKRRRY